MAINILDPSRATDKAICKDDAFKNVSSGGKVETAGKCGVGGSNPQASNTSTGLSRLWIANNSNQSDGGGNYSGTDTDNMGPLTSTTISRDVSNLNREQKGVVSPIRILNTRYSPGATNHCQPK